MLFNSECRSGFPDIALGHMRHGLDGSRLCDGPQMFSKITLFHMQFAPQPLLFFSLEPRVLEKFMSQIIDLQFSRGALSTKRL